MLEPSRYYIYNCLAQTIGLVNIENKGVFGIESLYDAILSGTSSTFLLSKDARSKNFYFQKRIVLKGQDSQDIQVTIDANLNYLVYKELNSCAQKFGCKQGACVIVDPNSGDILSMVSWPDFNPNQTQDMDIESTKNLVIADAYERGSVIKTFLALAALQEGIVDEDTLIDCEGKKVTKIDGQEFSTVVANGVITFTDVMRYSNNIGVAKVGKKLGVKLYNHYKKLGFGKKVDILPGENQGILNSPKTWSKASLLSLSFGYEMSINMLQLARAFCIVANDGYYKPIHIVKNLDNIKTQGPLYDYEVIQKLKNILIATVETGGAKRAKINGYKIYGKTGTARLLTDGLYDKTRLLYTFGCIFEHVNKKWVIITSMKEPQDSSLLAGHVVAPLNKKIIEKIIIKDVLI